MAAAKYALEGAPIKQVPVAEARAALAQHMAARPGRDDINALTAWALRRDLLQCQLDVATGDKAVTWQDASHPRYKPGQVVNWIQRAPEPQPHAGKYREPKPATNGQVLAPRVQSQPKGTPGEIRRALAIHWETHEALMAELDGTDRAGLRYKIRRKLYKVRGLIAAESVALGLPEPTFPRVSNYRSARRAA